MAEAAVVVEMMVVVLAVEAAAVVEMTAVLILVCFIRHFVV